MPRVQLVANTPKKVLTGAWNARDGGVGYSLKVPADGDVVEIDSVSIAVGEGYEIAPGEAYGETLAVGEDLWAVSATSQEVQLKISGIHPDEVLA